MNQELSIDGGRYSHLKFSILYGSIDLWANSNKAWITYTGWQAFVTSSVYLIGTIIQALIILNNDSYIPQAWQGILLFWAVLGFGVFVNTIARKALARFEGLVLVVHIFGFLSVMIPLVYLAPHGDSKTLLTTFNGGEWSTDGLSFVVGLSGAVFSLLGADSTVHVSIL